MGAKSQGLPHPRPPPGRQIPDGVPLVGCAVVSYLGVGSRHQQHDARTHVAGERRHGFLPVLDILAVNLKGTHKRHECTRRRTTAGNCQNKTAML